MARIRLYNNAFEDKFEEFEIEAGSSILNSVEKKINKRIYKETLVECYDTETGKTFFAPLEDEESQSVIIYANGVTVDKDYSPKEHDLISVMFMPSGDHAGKVLGTIFGVIGGILAGVAFVGSMAMTFGATASVGALIFGGFVGGVFGGISGYAIGAQIDKMRNQKSMQQKGLKEGSQAPDVRGANNTSLRGNNYPFVIGKHLITPFIVGDPYTTYEGERGRDAYIRVMLCAGYAPLKLTDFKLGEFLLCYNRDHGNVSMNTMISGLLKGYSVAPNPADSGDILDLWKNNDIELEIIQQAPGQAINRGTIYTLAVDDQQIDANVLFIADKAIDDLAPVTYKGVSFPNNFRTNGVFFTASCPQSFTVNIDFPNGLYSSYTKTEDNVCEALYGDIPVWMCIQWRPYNKNNASSDPNGSDYNSWYNLDFGYNEEFTTEKATQDVIAHRGNDFSSYYVSKVEEEAWNERTKFNSGYNQYETVESKELTTTEAEMENLDKLYGNYVGKVLSNFQPLSGGEEGMSQTRVSCTVNLTKEQCKLMTSENNPTKSIEIRVIRVSPGYINMTHNVDDNVSAYNYSDLVKVTSIVTTTFDEDILRTEDRVESTKVQSDADYKKFCYVAIKAKADASGYIINQLNKLNCTAESFSPYWDMTTKKLMPEGIHKVTNYYGYYNGSSTAEADRCNRSSAAGVTERLVTKAQYEKARHDGFNWYEDKAGSNFSDVIKGIVFTNRTTHNDQPCYYLNANAAKYNNNCVSSGFLLGCVGAQNGSEACGYEDINLIAMGDWAESTDALTDGSTFPVATEYRGHQYARGDEIPVHYEANGYLYQGQKLEDLLTKLAIAGRALWIIDETGKIKVIMDKPTDYYKGAISLQDCIQNQNSFSYEKLPAGLLIQFADENDGYETNSIYCWTDGNSIKNYHGNVESYSFDFVTNPYQLNSLGLYMLACRVAAKESLVRKIGINGELYSVGDVLLVQSDELLIGETSGRIQEVIEVQGRIYGFVVDSEYDYTAEIDPQTGNSTQGVTVVQPGYLGKSRTVTLPLSDPRTVPIDEIIHDGGDEIIIHHDYTLRKGRTNVVLIGKVGGSQDYGVLRSNADPSATTTDKYGFKVGDVVLFGLIDKIAAPYRVSKIKPEKGGQFSEYLIPYDEGFYRYGKELPTFQNYITPPPVVEPPIPLTEVPSRLSDQNNKGAETMKEVGFLKDNTPPSPPLDVSVVASRDRITFNWGVFDPEKVKHTVIELLDRDTDTWVVVGTTAARNWDYYFVRPLDGYPEAAAVEDRLYRLKNVSIFGIDSEYWYGTPDVTTYGTWQPATPSISSKIPSVETIEINWNDYQGQGGRPLYGNNHFELKIKYNGVVRKVINTDETSYIYSFNRNVDGYPEVMADQNHPGLDLYSFDLKVYNESGKYGQVLNQQFSAEEVQDYGTWIIPEVTVNKEIVDRTVILTAVYGGSKKVYGRILTLAKIKRTGNADISNGYTFNNLLAITPDEEYFTPEYDLSVQTALVDHESHYKKDTTSWYSSISNKITHTLPLIGQTPRIFKDGLLILENGACIEDIADDATIPQSPSEGDMIHFVGTAEGFVTNAYYLYTDSSWTRLFSKFTKDVSDYSSIPQNPQAGDVIHFVGTDPNYVTGGYYYYDGNDWILVQSKSMIVPTTYFYEIAMTNESGSVSNIVETETTAQPTNISDIVHSHEHYKDLYVEKLSAINANLGMISQGGMGSFDDMLNCWALSDLSAEDSGVIGGVMKGTFRVGDDNEYFRVTPYVDPNDHTKRNYKIELKAGNIELTTDINGDTAMDFTNGTFIYNNDRTARMRLASQGLIIQKQDFSLVTPSGGENPSMMNWYELVDNRYVLSTDTTVNNQKDYYVMYWSDVSKFIADERGNMIISNSDESPDFGLQVKGDVYHFDDPLHPTDEEVGESETATNPQNISFYGELVNNNGEVIEVSSSAYIAAGYIAKDVSSFTGNVVFLSKANEIVTSNKGIRYNGTVHTVPNLLTGYNNAMKQTSSIDINKTVGGYLGLNETQVRTGIFY